MELHVEREVLVGGDLVDRLVIRPHVRLGGELSLEGVGLRRTLYHQDHSAKEHRGIGVALDPLDRLRVVERRDTATAERREMHEELL